MTRRADSEIIDSMSAYSPPASVKVLRQNCGEKGEVHPYPTPHLFLHVSRQCCFGVSL